MELLSLLRSQSSPPFGFLNPSLDLDMSALDLNAAAIEAELAEGFSLGGVGDRGEKRVPAPPRVESGVLDHDWLVALDEHRIVRTPRDGLRVVEIVEADVAGPLRWYGDVIRADRIAVGEVDGDRDVGVLGAGVEEAGGFVTELLGFRADGAFGDITLSDGPARVAGRGRHKERGEVRRARW
jgi:hypothetical protein